MKWLDFWKSGIKLIGGHQYTLSGTKEVDLGRGFNPQSHMDTPKERLQALCEQTVKDPSLFPKTLDGNLVTYCNIAVRRIASILGCSDFHENDTANDMIGMMEKSLHFAKVSGEDAFDYAEVGKLAIAAEKHEPHGHIAVIYPSGDMYLSPSLRKEVPFVANVGKKNGIIPASEAFPVAVGEPAYYVWG